MAAGGQKLFYNGAHGKIKEVVVDHQLKGPTILKELMHFDALDGSGLRLR